MNQTGMNRESQPATLGEETVESTQNLEAGQTPTIEVQEDTIEQAPQDMKMVEPGEKSEELITEREIEAQPQIAENIDLHEQDVAYAPVNTVNQANELTKRITELNK